MARHTRWLDTLLLMAVCGCVIGLTHICISIELSVTLSYHTSLVRSLLLLLYPLGLAFMGAGAAFQPRLVARWPRLCGPVTVLRMGGLLLALVLLVIFRWNFLATSGGDLLAAVLLHVIVLVSWFFLLGVVLAALLTTGHQRGRFPTGIAWAVHVAGLLVGYLASDPFVYQVGVSATLACVAVALLLSPRLFPVLFAILAVSATAFGVDAKLEGYRDINDFEEGRAVWFGEWNRGACMQIGPRGLRPVDEDRRLPNPPDFIQTRWEVHQRWSRFGQVQVHQYSWHADEPTWLLDGFYNFVRQWTFRTGSFFPSRPFDELRRRVYGPITPSDRAVLVAGGAGRGLTALGFVPGKNFTVVELNDALVHLLRDERPDLNGHLYSSADAIGADGRYVIESDPGPFDYIIVESGRFHTARVTDPVGSAATIYTREAIDLYLERLRSSGILAINFNILRPHPQDEYLPLQVLRHLQEAGVAHAALGAVQLDEDLTDVYIIASPSEEGLDAYLELVSLEGTTGEVRIAPWAPHTGGDPRHGRALVDDLPFAHWLKMEPHEKRTLWLVALGLLLVTIGLGAAPSLRSRRDYPPASVAYFFLLGVGNIALQIATIYLFRSYFGDTVATSIRVICLFLAYGAVGAALAGRVVAWPGHGRLLLWVTLLVLVAHVVVLQLLPFGSSSSLARTAFACVAMLPAGLLSGFYFPAGVMAIRDEKTIGGLYLSDSVGTLAGLMLFYLVVLSLGVRAYLWLAIVAYLAASVCYRRVMLAPRGGASSTTA